MKGSDCFGGKFTVAYKQQSNLFIFRKLKMIYQKQINFLFKISKEWIKVSVQTWPHEWPKLWFDLPLSHQYMFFIIKNLNIGNDRNFDSANSIFEIQIWRVIKYFVCSTQFVKLHVVCRYDSLKRFGSPKVTLFLSFYMDHLICSNIRY